jgi:hypothetical protein
VNLYYSKSNLRRYRPLGHILGEYLNIEPIFCEEDDIFKLAKPDDLVYYEFFIKPELHRICYVLGAERDIAYKWDSKIYQYNNLKDVVLIPNYLTYSNVVELLTNLDNIKSKFEKFIIFEEYGYGGLKNLVCEQNTSREEIYNKFKAISSLRVSDFLPNVHNVGIHFIIAGFNKVWLSPIADQLISNDIIFKGGKYPSAISDNLKNKVLESAHNIATVLSRDNYRGLGHIDFMIFNNNVVFTEINPRKASTTMCLSYMMEHCFNYSIPIIEYHAIRHNEILDVRQTEPDIPWILLMLNYNPDAPHFPGAERDCFGMKGNSIVIYNDFYDRCTFRIDIKNVI